jgi:hypothetical protein
VTLVNEKEKWRILKEAKGLSEAPGELKNIYMKKDMTIEERNQDWILRGDLKAKKAASIANKDGAVWIIHRGKVVNKARGTQAATNQDRNAMTANQKQNTLAVDPPPQPEHTKQPTDANKKEGEDQAQGTNPSEERGEDTQI